MSNLYLSFNEKRWPILAMTDAPVGYYLDISPRNEAWVVPEEAVLITPESRENDVVKQITAYIAYSRVFDLDVAPWAGTFTIGECYTIFEAPTDRCKTSMVRVRLQDTSREQGSCYPEGVPVPEGGWKYLGCDAYGCDIAAFVRWVTDNKLVCDFKPHVEESDENTTTPSATAEAAPMRN